MHANTHTHTRALCKKDKLCFQFSVPRESEEMRPRRGETSAKCRTLFGENLYLLLRNGLTHEQTLVSGNSTDEFGKDKKKMSQVR